MRILFLAVLVVFISCNSGKRSNERDNESAKSDSSSAINVQPHLQKDSPANASERKMPVADSVEEKLAKIIMALPEVKELIKDTAKLNKEGRRFAWMNEKPDETHSDYVFQIGYDSDERFETRYWIHINPNNLKVKFNDVISDSLYDPEDFRKLKIKPSSGF